MFRWVALTLLIILASLQYRLWIGASGMREVWRLEEAIEKQRVENASVARRNAELAAEVVDLKEGQEAVEERARSELGMVGSGELFYQVIEAQPQPMVAMTPQ